MPAKNTRNTFLLLTITVSLMACSSDSNNLAEEGLNNSDLGNSDDNSSMLAPGSDQQDVMTLDGLDGSWEQGCLANPDDATFSSATLLASDNTITVTESVFTDNACSIAAVPAIIETVSSLIFDGTTTTTALGDASNVELTVETRTIDDVSDTGDINSITYDMMLIINDTLYFGNKTGDNDGSTDELQPTTLDQVNIYMSAE